MEVQRNQENKKYTEKLEYKIIEQEKDYKLVRVGNFHKNNYTEYKIFISSDRNKAISIKKYLQVIKLYWKT